MSGSVAHPLGQSGLYLYKRNKHNSKSLRRRGRIPIRPVEHNNSQCHIIRIWCFIWTAIPVKYIITLACKRGVREAAPYECKGSRMWKSRLLGENGWVISRRIISAPTNWNVTFIPKHSEEHMPAKEKPCQTDKAIKKGVLRWRGVLCSA